ncbi:MAG: arylesterase [Campylobacterales bacterium]|nr:arylesterase [Campylobacterales bacterium]
MKKLIVLAMFWSMVHAKSILFLGDSLTEGYGVSKEEAYPKLVEEMIQKRLHQKVNVINGGVSGSTTSDGLARLQWYLKKEPTIVMIALGANDGLRGHDLRVSQANLEAIIVHAQKSGAKVLLAGMLVPPNYGEKYANEFRAMYEALQKKYHLKSIPFLLEGIAGQKEYNQADGIHPNAQGHALIAQRVFELIKEEL